MDPLSTQILTEVKGQIRQRLIEESVPRIEKCLGLLSPEQVWQRPNQELVSIGNLVLHLCGNVRQWLLSGLGGEQDVRERQTEFDERGPLPTQQLKELLHKLMQDIEQMLERLQAEDLTRMIEVQGFKESGLSVIVHVIEHFSYHTGQISWQTKLLQEVDLGYYTDLDLDITG